MAYVLGLEISLIRCMRFIDFLKHQVVDTLHSDYIIYLLNVEKTLIKVEDTTYFPTQCENSERNTEYGNPQFKNSSLIHPKS